MNDAEKQHCRAFRTGYNLLYNEYRTEKRKREHNRSQTRIVWLRARLEGYQAALLHYFPEAGLEFTEL